jgi:hypothetical protein
LQLQLDDDSVKLAPGSAWANEEYRREELERRARRTRNALIGTSAASVVGWSLLGIAQAQRFEVDSCPPSEQSWQSCKTRAGNNLVSTGMALGVSGLIGAFITGIMFGVQKGRLRRLQDVDDRTYTLEEVELRVKRAKIGLGVSVVASVVGLGMGFAAATGTLCIVEPCTEPGWVVPVGVAGVVLTAGGLAGMIAYGVLLRKRKRKLRRLEQAHYGTPRRVQWDLARSRLVF